MSYSYVILEINNEASVNDYTRLLRDLESNDVVSNIDFKVD